MALDSKDQAYGKQLLEKDKTNEGLIQQSNLWKNIAQSLMISMAEPLDPGGDTGRHSPKPGQKPSSPYEKGKSPYKGLQAGLQINPNSIMLPFVPKDAETDEDYGEGDVPGHPDWKMAHGEGRGPQPKYHDEYNRELPIPPWMQMDPSGKLIEIPWMKEEYLKEHPELRLQISGIPSSKRIRDRLKPFTKGGPYDDTGGSLRGIPDALRIQLLRDAMA